MLGLIIVSILLIVLNGIYISLILARLELSRNSSDERFIKSNVANILMALTLIIVTTIFTEAVFFSFLDERFLSVLLTVVSIALLSLLISVLPFINLSKNKPDKALQIFKIFDMLAYFIFYPFTLIYVRLRLVTFKKVNKTMTNDDVLTFIEKAEELKGINENESLLIKNVLRFDETQVLDIFTPRTDVIAVDMDDTINEIKETFKSSGYSRLPVYVDSIDNIVGTINLKEFVNKNITNKKELKKIITEPIEVTEYMSLNNLLSLLKMHKQHLAIVKDEFGGTLGIVSLEDIIEELVGDIYDEHDKLLVNILKKSEKVYHILGQTYIYELEDVFDVSELEEEEYLTVNGFVTAKLEKIPRVGDQFRYENVLVKVLKADSKKANLVEIEIVE